MSTNRRTKWLLIYRELTLEQQKAANILAMAYIQLYLIRERTTCGNIIRKVKQNSNVSELLDEIYLDWHKKHVRVEARKQLRDESIRNNPEYFRESKT